MQQEEKTPKTNQPFPQAEIPAEFQARIQEEGADALEMKDQLIRLFSIHKPIDLIYDLGRTLALALGLTIVSAGAVVSSDLQ
jgi:hypothetical protein